jgi:protein TonB
MAASSKKKKNKTDTSTLIIYGVVGIAFLGGIAFLVSLMLGDSSYRKREKIAVIKLIKPPPPPVEKPPEPEVPKEVPKQEVIEDIPQPQDSPQNDQPQDDTPAGEDLGVDAEGGAGSDAFGLRGKKGGRSITLGGGGGGLSNASLLAKYGWYTKKVEKELWQRVKSILDKDGGIPKGKHSATIHLVLNETGSVIRYKLVGSSGNEKIDLALKSALMVLKVSEPKPDGMPSGLTLKVSSQS